MLIQNPLKVRHVALLRALILLDKEFDRFALFWCVLESVKILESHMDYRCVLEYARAEVPMLGIMAKPEYATRLLFNQARRYSII